MASIINPTIYLAGRGETHDSVKVLLPLGEVEIVFRQVDGVSEVHVMVAPYTGAALYDQTGYESKRVAAVNAVLYELPTGEE